jgi:hypothetical protein
MCPRWPGADWAKHAPDQLAKAKVPIASHGGNSHYSHLRSISIAYYSIALHVPMSQQAVRVRTDVLVG